MISFSSLPQPSPLLDTGAPSSDALLSSSLAPSETFSPTFYGASGKTTLFAPEVSMCAQGYVHNNILVCVCVCVCVCVHLLGGPPLFVT